MQSFVVNGDSRIKRSIARAIYMSNDPMPTASRAPSAGKTLTWVIHRSITTLNPLPGVDACWCDAASASHPEVPKNSLASNAWRTESNFRPMSEINKDDLWWIPVDGARTGPSKDRRMSGDRDQSSSNSKHVFPASMSFSASWQRTSIVARRVRYLFTKISVYCSYSSIVNTISCTKLCWLFSSVAITYKNSESTPVLASDTDRALYCMSA
jgi:hypothetical protein